MRKKIHKNKKESDLTFLMIFISFWSFFCSLSIEQKQIQDRLIEKIWQIWIIIMSLAVYWPCDVERFTLQFFLIHEKKPLIKFSFWHCIVSEWKKKKQIKILSHFCITNPVILNQSNKIIYTIIIIITSLWKSFFISVPNYLIFTYIHKQTHTVSNNNCL